MTLPKRNRASTERNIKKRIADGRGQGRKDDYIPWLLIHDVPSQGLATRVKGWKTRRTHHFMSKLEWLYFFILEWSTLVVDIREQYPLDRDETLAIANDLGIKHPTDPKTKEPVVMTTDFLITSKKPIGISEHARTVKYAKELVSIRVMEKFEIERVYWALRGIDWGIVTERDINPIIAASVEWLHPYRDIANLTAITNDIVQRVESILTPQITQSKAPLSDLTDLCDHQLELETGTSLLVVRHLLANRKWEVDMSKGIQPKQKLSIIASRSTLGL
jgi:hypothetical protein